jgi:hypothetical protein
MTGIDADGILIRQVQMIGYPEARTIDGFASIRSESLLKLLVYIFGKIPSTQNHLGPPPTGKSALFRYSTEIVNLIAGLGYGFDLRYDNFLYPKAEVTRSVLRFLLDKVPRTATAGPSASAAAVSQLGLAITAAQLEFAAAQKVKDARKPLAQPLPLLNRSLAAAAQQAIEGAAAEPKIAFYAAPVSANGIPFNVQTGPNVFASLLAQNDREVSFDFAEIPPAAGGKLIRTVIKRAFAVAASAATEAAPAVQAPTGVQAAKVTSLLENKARFEFGVSDTKIGATAVAPTAAAMKKSASSDHDLEKAADKDEAAEPKLTVDQVATLRAELQAEVDEGKARLAQLEEGVATLETQMENDRASVERIREQQAGLAAENERLQVQAEQLANVAKISSSDASQIQRLKADLTDSAGRLMDIAGQWEPHRARLITEYRELASALRIRNVERSQLMKKLEKLKRQIRESTEKVASAETQIVELDAAVRSRGEQWDRHHYIEIIFRMIKEIEVQEADVEKVRVKIISQHQRMNQTIETVKRTWSLLDETVYTAAKKGQGEEWVKKTYKQAVELLTLSESISEDVEDIGKLTAQAMETKSKIARVEEQSDPEALARISADLDQIRQEIASLGGGD